MFTLALVTLAVLQVAPGAGNQPGITEPLEAGSRLLRAGELESARIRFQEVIRLCPTCAEGYALVALTDMSAGRYAAAVEGYKRALQLQPDDPALHEQIANAYLQLGEWQEARVGFQRTLHRVPRSPQSVYGLAIIAFVEARYDESVALLEQALRLAPENAKIQYQLYAAYLNAGDADRAIAALQRAVELEPRNHALHLQLAQLYLSRATDREAIGEYETVARMDPSNIPVRITLGFLLLDSERARARKSFQEAFQRQPVEAEKFFFRSLRTLFDAEQLGPRAKELIGELELPISVPAQHLGLARAHLEAQQLELALAQVERHLTLSPRSADGWHVKGVILEKRMNAEPALTAFERARALDPTNPEVDLKIADLCLRLGRLSEARAALSRGLERDPREPRLLYQLGLLEQKQGRFAQALVVLRKVAARLDSAEVHYRMAQIARQLGDTKTSEAEMALFEQWKKQEDARERLQIIRPPQR